MRITAALLRQPGAPLSIEEVELDDPGPEEVRVAVRGAGICHTDLGVAAGGLEIPLPFVLGHEGAGVVEEVGSAVETLHPGDHVVLSFGSCGTCTVCQRGRPAYCELFPALNYSGGRLDETTALRRDGEVVHSHFFSQSSFASHALASVRNAVKVPDDLPIELLGPLGCGVQTGAGTVLRALAAERGSGLAVFGTGAVGLSAIMAARVAGCEPVVAVDINPQRLEIARELGATLVVNSSEDDPVATIMDATGTGVDYSIEATGLGPVIRQALECLRVPGVCATLGFQGMVNEVTIDQGHLLSGRTLAGVIEGSADPQEFIPHLVELWREGRLPFDRLIERFDFERINEAFAAAHEGRAIKPVLVFE